MDTRESPSVKPKKDSRGFSAGLANAFHEWFFMFLLFVNALFSYSVTKFARSNKLKPPCLLCSRLDHVIGNENPGFYKDLICAAHKLEISSLVYCHIHDKLADVRDMCEGCLFSFSSENKSDVETNWFLVGKLGNNLESRFYLDASHKDQSSKKQCSCCQGAWTTRAYDQNLFQKKSIVSKGKEGHCPLSHGDGLETGNKKISGQLKTSYLRSRSFEALSHIGYSELKLTSESESEVPLSEDDDDDDDTITMAHNGEEHNEEIESHCVTQESTTVTAQIHNDSSTMKSSSQCPSPALMVQLPNEKIDVEEPDYLTPLHSTQGGLPTIPVEVLNEKTGVSELDYSTSMHSDQAGSPSLSIQVPKGKMDACEPDYLTPVLSDQTRTSTLSVAVQNEKFDLGEPDYSTPVLSDQPGLHTLSIQVPKEKTDADEPHYLTPVLSDQAGVPLLSVQLATDQVEVGEPEYLTPVPSNQTDSPLLSIQIPKDSIDMDEHRYLTPLSSARAGSLELQVLVPDQNIDVHEPNYLTPLAFSDAMGHGLEELDWHQSEQQNNPTAPPEDVPQKDISSIAEPVVEASKGTLSSVTGLEQAVTIKTEIVAEFKNDQPSTTSGLCSQTDEATNTLHAEETGNSGQNPGTEDEEIHKLEAGSTTSEPDLKTDSVSNGVGHTTSNLVNSKDSLKMVIGNKGNPISAIFAEQLTPKNSTIHEDLKLLLSQAARGVERSSNDMSPSALERYESGIESLDGSVVSEIDGESVVDRLKRQIEHDRKSMNALYKELEEERNASAIAANQAMAMITRLQEEKASLHMEALQYLRMMEEQAEYDVDALQKANVLLAEREKDIQDLEEELYIYRMKFPDIDAIQDSCCYLSGVGEVRIEQSDVSCSDLPSNSLLSKKNEDENKPEETDANVGYTSLIKDSLSEFEDERLYICGCLKKLEAQVNLLPSNKACANKSNGGHLSEECHGVNSSSLQNGHLENNESTDTREHSPAGNDQVLSKENHHPDSYQLKEYIADRGTDLFSLENEVSDLNERLEALETDRSFVEHTINALRKNGEGMQFVQEIAHHLRELRRIGIKRLEQTVT